MPVAAEPILRGAPSLRDLGGLPAAGGRTTVAGKLYRSEALVALSRPEQEQVDRIGFRAVVDLRAPHERREDVIGWRASAQPTVLGATADEARHGAMQRQLGLAANGSRDAIRDAMIDSYRHMPDAFALHVGGAIASIAADEVPILIACAVGKDRTGFVVAATLLAAGVTFAAVERDFMASNALLATDRIADAFSKAYGKTPTAEFIQSLSVRPEYLEAALAALTERYGSFDAYLEGAARMTDHQLAAFHERFLTSPGQSSPAAAPRL